jgi:copper homeostasis protein (lipoprotein)
MHFILALVIIFVSTCTASAQSMRGTATYPERVSRPTAPESIPTLDPLPASFVGVLPCADCPGVFYQLNLSADGVFFFRMAYRDMEESIDDVGRWVLSCDGRVVVMKGARETLLMFAIADGDTLRPLNMDGDGISSTLDYELRRLGGLDLFEPRLNVSGMYRYVADAGIFTECATGRRLVVADKHENDALESAYEAVRQQPGEEVKVLVNARLVVHPGFDNGLVQLALVVERFMHVFPGERCGVPFSALPLENTYRRATQLEGQPVPAVDPGSQAYLIFEAGGRVSGSDGCNRVAGTYRLNGDAIWFGPMASTRMAWFEPGVAPAR